MSDNISLKVMVSCLGQEHVIDLEVPIESRWSITMKEDFDRFTLRKGKKFFDLRNDPRTQEVIVEDGDYGDDTYIPISFFDLDSVKEYKVIGRLGIVTHRLGSDIHGHINNLVNDHLRKMR